MPLAWKPLDGQSGHAVAYALLSQLLGAPLPQILRTKQGKPYFEDSPLHFSISHTDRHAFCFLGSQNVGIDAEEADRKVSFSLAEKILSPTELARFHASADKQSTLLRLWVLKEALAKLTGRGLGNWIKTTDFDPNDPRISIIDGCYVAVLQEEELS